MLVRLQVGGLDFGAFGSRNYDHGVALFFSLVLFAEVLEVVMSEVRVVLHVLVVKIVFTQRFLQVLNPIV